MPSGTSRSSTRRHHAARASKSSSGKHVSKTSHESDGGKGRDAGGEYTPPSALVILTGIPALPGLGHGPWKETREVCTPLPLPLPLTITPLYPGVTSERH